MNLASIQRNFDQLGREDPLWTVLSDNAKRGGKWDPDEFYQIGEDEIAALEARCAAHGIPFHGELAVDFGCGVGRLTFPLSRRFDRCLGIDIAPSMIEQAVANASRGRRTEFILTADTSLPQLADGSVDFAFADIVFQHMPNRYTRRYLRSLSRALKPGGILAFQMPSHLDPAYPRNQRAFPMLRKRIHYLTRYASQLLRPNATEPYFEMRPYPRDRLARFLARHCCLQVLAIDDYPASGPAWKSFLYLARKPVGASSTYFGQP